MIMEISVLTPHSSSGTFNGQKSTKKDEYCLNDSDSEIAQLVSNLDHEISPIRVRALNSLQMKLELGLIQTDYLCKRIDFLHRISRWLHCSKLSEDELHLILKFLLKLSQDERFIKTFLSKQLDSLLSIAKLVVRPDTRNLINQLLGSVKSIDSFHMYHEDSPAWGGNYSIASQSPRSNIFSTSPTRINTEGDPLKLAVEAGQGEGKIKSQQEFYFKISNSRKHRRVTFGIPTVLLQATDRRVLTSAIESLLSKDESLSFLTTCFIRDVLLNDFPAELFIQESSLTFGLLQVLEEQWDNEEVNYCAFQALLKLSNSLRGRFIHLDSSDFYDHNRYFEQYKPRQKTTRTYHYLDVEEPFASPRESSTEYFLDNLSQFVKGIVRGLNYKSRCTSLWILLSDYCLTLENCLKRVPKKSSTILVSIQEILLELSQYFLKFSRHVYPPLMAPIMISLLSSLGKNGSIILSKDIRHAMWNLVTHTNLQELSPVAFQHFVDAARLFDPTLGNSEKVADGTSTSEFSLDNLYNEWWRYNKLDTYGKDVGAEQESKNPESRIRGIFYAIQNATEHNHVKEALNDMWETIGVLVLNSRMKNHESSVDNEVLSQPNIIQWKESFDKFLSAEPTCSDDEELLARILDIFAYVISWQDDSQQIRSWIEPMVTEKGSAILHVLTHCTLGGNASPTEGTVLKTCHRSVFDFYTVVCFGKGALPLGTANLDLLQILAQLLEKIACNSCIETAAIQSVLQGLANLSSSKHIVDHLVQDYYKNFVNALLNLLAECIYLLQEKAGVESFRNQTSIQHAAQALLQLAGVLAKDKSRTPDWSLPIIKIIPLLWSSTDCITRTIGFQICAVIIRTSKGLSHLVANLEFPALIWNKAHRHFLSPDEVPIVRWASARLLVCILNSWEEIRHLMDRQVEIPKWEILQGIQTLLVNMFWHSSLSQNGYAYEGELGNIEESQALIITPKVLQLAGKVANLLLSVPENRQHVPVSSEGILRNLSSCLLRLASEHHLNSSMNALWWLESCNALSSIMETLTKSLHIQPSLTTDIFSDKMTLTMIVKLFEQEIPPVSAKVLQAQNALEKLWFHSTTFITILSSASKHHFEDLERIILANRAALFSKLILWLDVSNPRQWRSAALEFFIKLFSLSCSKDECGKGRSILSNLWQETKGEIGEELGNGLVKLLTVSTNIDEKISILICCDVVSRFFQATVFSVSRTLIKLLVKTLTAYSVKQLEVPSQYEKKDVKVQEELKWTFCLLSTMLQLNYDCRKEALQAGLSDAIHTTKITSQVYSNSSERVILHRLIDCLVNFTYEFPEGAHSLTLTTGLLGVPSRKIATVNSLLIEMLGLLQAELDNIETNCNLHTVDLIMSLMNNVAFSVECRSILVKTNVLNFIQKLHYNRIKKWNTNQQHVKLAFLQFLVHLTVHSEMQLHFGKIDEAVEILVQLAEFDNHLSRLMALEILRNLSFNPGNRARLITDPEYLRYLSEHLRSSESLQEIECSVVAIWALVSNFERGKVAAKNYNITFSLPYATQRLQKRSPNTSKEQERLSSIINLLRTVVA